VSRLLVLLLLALPLAGQAATISGTACTPTVSTGCVILPLYLYNGTNSVSVQITGTWTGEIVFEGSNDNSNFRPLVAYAVPAMIGDLPPAPSATATANGFYTVPTRGAVHMRIRASAWTSGAAEVIPQPSTATVATDIVRAVGSTFGAVDVSGTVNLSSATLASMGNYICDTAESRRLSLTTTSTVIPAGAPIANRTSWTLLNQDSSKKVTCRVDPGDGGVPDCATPGFGITVQPNGGRLTIPVRESDVVRCVACVAGATIEYTEEACTAP